MKIKILNNIKQTKLKLCAVSLSGLMLASSLAGCAKENNDNAYQYDSADDKVFSAGEHIISVPIEDPTKEIRQYEYHDGYKVVGITSSAYGRLSYYFDEAYLLYENEYPVECHASGKNDDNEIVYADFGYPIEFEKVLSDETPDTKFFEVGEHIISVPIEDSKGQAAQYEYHEGYEAIGINTASYGRLSRYYGGGCILYVNIEPVECEKTKDSNETGKYTSFGTPIEKEKAKGKK